LIRWTNKYILKVIKKKENEIKITKASRSKRSSFILSWWYSICRWWKVWDYKANRFRRLWRRRLCVRSSKKQESRNKESNQCLWWLNWRKENRTI